MWTDRQTILTQRLQQWKFRLDAQVAGKEEGVIRNERKVSNSF